MRSSNQRGTNNPLPAVPTSNQTQANMHSLPTLPNPKGGFNMPLPLSVAISGLTTLVSAAQEIYNKVQQDRQDDNEFLLYLEGLNKRMEKWELQEDNFQEEGQGAAQFGVHMLEIALEAATSKLKNIYIKQEGGFPSELKEVIVGDGNTIGILNQLKDAETLVYQGMVVDLHRNQQKQHSVVENLTNAFSQLNLDQTTNKLGNMHDAYKQQLVAMQEECIQRQTIFFAGFFQKQDEQLFRLQAMVDSAKHKELLQNREQLDNRLLVEEKLIDTKQLETKLNELHAEYDTYIKDTYLDSGLTENIDAYYKEAKNLADFTAKIQQTLTECENELKKLEKEKKKTKEIRELIKKLDGEKKDYSEILADEKIQDFSKTEQKLQKLSDKLNQLDQKNKKESTALNTAAFFTHVKATAKRDMRVNTSQQVESDNATLTLTASKIEKSKFKSGGNMQFDMHQQAKSNNANTLTIKAAEVEDSEFESDGDFVFNGSQHITLGK